MKYGLRINKSFVVRTAGLALVAAIAVSFAGLSHADTTYQFTVNVSDACGPIVAKAVIVNGPDDGAFGITDASGQFTFNLHAGVFYVHFSADGHSDQDSGTIVLTSDQSTSVILSRNSGDCGGSSFVNLNFLV